MTVDGRGDGPGPGADGEGQRVGGLNEGELPAVGLWSYPNGGEGSRDGAAVSPGGHGERPAGPRAPVGGSRPGTAGRQFQAVKPGAELVLRASGARWRRAQAGQQVS